MASDQISSGTDEDEHSITTPNLSNPAPDDTPSNPNSKEFQPHVPRSESDEEKDPQKTTQMLPGCQVKTERVESARNAGEEDEDKISPPNPPKIATPGDVMAKVSIAEMIKMMSNSFDKINADLRSLKN